MCVCVDRAWPLGLHVSPSEGVCEPTRVQAGLQRVPEKVGSPGPCSPFAPCRMDPFEDTLQRLREAFRTGRTRPAEFRAAQLKGLGRFLQENKQLLQEALAQDLHKVMAGPGGGGGEAGVGCVPSSFLFL